MHTIDPLFRGFRKPCLLALSLSLGAVHGVHASFGALEKDGDDAYKRQVTYSHGDKEATYTLRYKREGKVFKIQHANLIKTKGDKMLGGVGPLEYFDNYKKIDFQEDKQGNLAINLATGTWKSDIVDDTKNAYLLQVLSYIGTAQDHLHAGQFAMFKADSGQAQYAGKDPFFGVGGYFAARGTDLTYSALGYAFKTERDQVQRRNPNAAAAHLLAELLNTRTPQQLYDAYYSREVQKKIEQALDNELYFDQLRDPKTILSAVVVLSCASVVFKGSDYSFKFGYDVVSKWWETPTFIEYMTNPRNRLEVFKFWLFGKPARLKDTWDKIILDPVIKAQREAYYNRLKYVVEYNRGLTYKERLQGMGMTMPFLLLSGPPGVGKTMFLEGLVARAEREGYVNVIRIKGSAASGVDEKDINPAMDELYNIAEQVFLLDGTMTVYVIDEGEAMFQDHLNPKVSEKHRALTRKFINRYPDGRHRFSVYMITTNVDVTNEKEARKVMDWAALKRFPTTIPFAEIQDDEHGRKTLFEAFMVHFKDAADEVGLKVDSSVAPYVKEHLPKFTQVYNTPRDMGNFSRDIVITVAEKMAGKKRKKHRKIGQDHVMQAFVEEEAKQAHARKASYRWSE